MGMGVAGIKHINSPGIIMINSLEGIMINSYAMDHSLIPDLKHR